jgi:hypothetical protein
MMAKLANASEVVEEMRRTLRDIRDVSKVTVEFRITG